MSKLDFAQVAPPATVVAATIYGFTLQDWASILAIVLLLMQIGWFVWERLIKPRREKRRRK